MGFFDKLFGKEKEVESIQVETEKNTLYLPIEGEVIPLADIGDGVFSDAVLGQGCGIQPKDETVYAPVNGTVTNIADTKHAVGILSDDGVEILIHVGMDTVDMNGDGFQVLIKADQKVKCGQPLLKFSMEKIKAAGHPSTTAFIVTNSDDYSEIKVLQTGDTAKLTAVMKVE